MIDSLSDKLDIIMKEAGENIPRTLDKIYAGVISVFWLVILCWLTVVLFCSTINCRLTTIIDRLPPTQEQKAEKP